MRVLTGKRNGDSSTMSKSEPEKISSAERKFSTTSKFTSAYIAPSAMKASRKNDESKCGVEVQAVLKNGKRYPHRFYLSTDNRKIICAPGGRSGGMKVLFKKEKHSKNAIVIDISTVDRVQRGQFTAKFFASHQSSKASTFDADEANSFSILYDKCRASLDLVIADVGDYEMVFKTVSELMEVYEGARQNVHLDVLLLENLWISADKDLDEPASVNELQTMFESVSVGIKKKHFIETYKKFCDKCLLSRPDGLSITQAVELVTFFRRVKVKQSREDDPFARVVKRIMDTSAEEADHEKQDTGAEIFTMETVTAEAFLKFLRTKQKEKRANISYVHSLFQRLNQLHPGDSKVEKESISKSTLEAYMMSAENDVFNPIKAKDNRADLTKPLSNYWINSSHKTYLATSDEKAGVLGKGAKASTYLNALYRGCRCLEVDIYDGGMAFQKEPVVCENEKVLSENPSEVTLFADVLNAIKKFLASHPNSLPIILCMENHCSIPYQEVMVSHLMRILDEHLYSPKYLVGVLPSPDSIRGQVVLKGKRPENIGNVVTMIDDDFDAQQDFSPEEAAEILNRAKSITMPGEDQHLDINSDILSIVSDTPAVTKSPEECLREATKQARETRKKAKEAEEYAFQLQVQATKSEELAAKFLGKLGLTFDELDIIERQRNQESDCMTVNTETTMKPEVINKLKDKYLNPLELKASHSDQLKEKATSDNFVEPLGTGVEVSSSFDDNGQGLEVKDFFANEVDMAASRYSHAEAEQLVANNEVSIAMVELQEAISSVYEATRALQDAESLQEEATEKARQAASIARINREHADTAAKRVVTVQELFQKRRDARAGAESVASTANAEASISEQRAEESETRAAKAFDTAQNERQRADDETKKEEQFESQAALLHKNYTESVKTVKSARAVIDKHTSELKAVDKQIRSIEESTAYKEEKQGILRRRQGISQDEGDDSGRLTTKHGEYMKGRQTILEKLQEANAAYSSCEAFRKKAQKQFDEATVKARDQAEIAAVARRQADKSTALAERLAEQAEEERDAANLRLVASEKAEISVQRAEAELSSTKAQLVEAEKAVKESEELAITSRLKAEESASGAVRDSTAEREDLAKKKELQEEAQKRYDEAIEIKEKVDAKVAEAKKALDRSTEIYSLARDEIAAETHRLHAVRQSEHNAIVLRMQARFLRRKASDAQAAAIMSSAKAAEAAVAETNARSYKKKKDKITNMSERLAKMILINGTPFKFWEKSLSLPYLHMHSLCEGFLVHLTESGPKEWTKLIEFNKRHMTRTFPSHRMRKSATNYNPMIAWAMGCQLVGMNTQSSSGMMLLVDGRFRENGSSGYVLKPDRLISKSIYKGDSPPELARTLRLRILCGRDLPKPDGAFKRSQPVSPRVKVVIYDGYPGKGSVQHTTRTVESNGLYPVWDDEGATFSVTSPSVAMVLFSVWDKDDEAEKDYFIAASAIPFSCLRQGYRSVPLFDANRSRGGVYGTTSLFIEISMQ